MSSGYFPGAPLNTGPITTNATSSAETVTSPSSATHAPRLASSLVVPPVPASSSADSKATAPEETPASSSAKDAPATSEASEPATTSTSSTTGTATSTTTTTSTATTTTDSKAVTTTTNVTTTIATGRISPVISMETIFQETIKRCNNCLFLIRKLRSKQDHVTNLFISDSSKRNNFDGTLQTYKDFGVMVQEMMATYERLDVISRRLPKVVPPTDNINIMRTLYSQEHTMSHANITHLVERMIDSGNWNEGNFQIFHYLSELLRFITSKRKSTVRTETKVLPEVTFNTLATTGHNAFEIAYKAMKKEIVNKSLGIYPRTISRSATGLVIEFLFGCGGAKTTVTNDKDIVYTMKFLIVERCGIVEFINMVAADEEWESYNDFRKKTINPFGLSRYEVYRRLTKQANTHLLNCFGTHTSRWTANTLIQFVSLFGKFREIFTTRCRLCRKILRNFLPPLVFDIRTPNNACHETCRA